jgi:NAD(P)-dependent dehydrogenase (short-subunit alcohol dehydrogenase family)
MTKWNEVPVDPRAAYDLAGQVAVVTGAGRGIGEGIAKVYARAGASVVLAARRTEEIERVEAEIVDEGGQAVAVTTDVTSRNALEHLADAAIAEYGSLSIWVNNAGGSPHRTPLTELSRDGWDDCVDLNLTAIWEASVVAADRMNDGAILNISSMASHGPTPGSGHYAAVKAATNSLTYTFARELAPRIRVNAIAPGAVPTEIMMHALDITMDDMPKLARHIPMGRVGAPDDLGMAALFLVAPASAWITGQVLNVSGGPR